MIYALVGTNTLVREKHLKELNGLGEVTRHIYSEQISELEPLVEAMSLFGGRDIVHCLQLSDNASSKEELTRILPKLQNSNNVFIIDEPFADIHTFNRLIKFSKKVFDAREEKVKQNDVFALCDAFVARNKKQAWTLFTALKDKESGEAIAGALWWKFQGEWLKVKDGKKSLFTKTDCEVFGEQIISAPIKAHRGENDLLVELEKIILSL